jgi:hypothetical protein
MSWSDDTRCLYCEGRLPLYRKISHGQFCSSAHRKAYWQEHERLAVERLHQTHNTLRTYRPVAQAAAPNEVPEEAHAELASYAEPETATLVTVPLSGLGPGLEMDPDPDLYPTPVLAEVSPPPASDLLNLLASGFLPGSGCSPNIVTADPIEYEITREPLAPPLVACVLETKPLPEGQPIAALAPPASASAPVARGDRRAEEESEVAFRYPGSLEPTVGIRVAGRVALPLSVSSEPAPVEMRVKPLEMEPAPVANIALDVPLQGDVLVELVDQQVPHPDQMHALGQFEAHRSALVLACPPPQQIDVAPTMVPVASVPATPDPQLFSATEMFQLPVVVLAEQRNVASLTVISDIPVKPQVSTVAMLALDESANQVDMAGLQSLPANRLRSAQRVLALQTTDSMALGLAAGVSSDTTFPSLARGASAGFAPRFTGFLPLVFGKKRKLGAEGSRQPIVRLLPQVPETHPALPHSGLEPLDRKPAEDVVRTQGTGPRGDGLKRLEPVWAHATGFWQHAPRDLKLLLFAIPALLALVFHPGLPRISSAAPRTPDGFSGSFKRVLNDQWGNVRQTLENRAAIALDEDFRSGLDNWASPGGSTTEWSFDSTGFVQPGPLALYRPSVNLADYQVQFLGLIDKKAMSWVVRAADFENFYVVKLVVLKSGPMPAIGLTRYAVIHGQAMDRHDVTIPVDARTDTLYRVRMDVQGSDFALEVQGLMADSWTETRLPRGGVGFFSANGEASRLRWVQITHQYDMLGRLCAYLAPFDTTNGSWQP